MKNICFIVFSLLVALNIKAQYNTIELNPVSDGFVREQDGAGVFNLQYTEVRNVTKYSRETYLDFNLSDVDIDVKSASLNLFCSNYNSGTDGVLDLYAVYGNHCGSDLTWESRLMPEQMDSVSTLYTNKTEHMGVVLQWKTSDFIKKAIADGQKEITFVIKARSSSALIYFATVESPSNKPVLLLSEEPESEETDKKDLVLASLFTNNMVLQRDEKNKIWGTGLPGEKVEVYFDDTLESTDVCDDSGYWEIFMTERPADNAVSHTVKVCSGKDEILLENVVLGDVWLASGQSNMAFQVMSLKDDQLLDAMSDCDYPNLRYYDVAKIVNGGVLVNGVDKPWIYSASTSIETWSAVSFFFAREVHLTQNIPVGIINCSHGGAPADAFISEEAYASDFLLNSSKCPDGEGIYQYYKTPSSLFNKMVKKLVGYNIKGVIWYQAEANGDYADKYEIVFKGLINDWRNQWNKPDLPFLFVQLPAYERTDDGGDSWAVLREAQLETWKTTPNTGMAVTMELGDYSNIHPTNKKPVGHRLALYARGMVYGEKDIVYKSPIFKSAEIDGNNIVLSFDNMTGPLVNVKDITEFEVCGEDGNFYPAEAVIEGENVILKSDMVENPLAARYAWANASTISLFNKEGLPLSPFRTMKPEKDVINGEILFEEIKNVYASSTYPGRDAIYAVNGEGLSEDGSHVAIVNAKAWHSNGAGVPATFKIELKNPEVIVGMHYWNLNWSSQYLARGTKNVEIWVSDSADDLSQVGYDDERWIKLSDIETQIADGTSEYKGERFDFVNDKAVRWFGLNIVSLHSDSELYTGISEIKLIRKTEKYGKVTFSQSPEGGFFRVLNGEVEIKSGDDVVLGSTLSIEVNPDDGYKVKGVWANNEIVNNSEAGYSVTVENDTEIRVEFEKELTSISDISNSCLYYDSYNQVLYSDKSPVFIYDISGKLLANTSRKIIPMNIFDDGVYIAVVKEYVYRFIK